MNIKKNLAELSLFAFLLTGCSTSTPQNKPGEFPGWLYSKIDKDIEYILERGKKDTEISCEINNEDLYHVHACLKENNEKDSRIKTNEIAPQKLVFLYHSRELLPNENIKRNMFHNADGTWEILKNSNHKGICPEERGLKSVTIYFGRTKSALMENPVDEATIRKVGDYYFGVSNVFPFLKE